MFCSECCIVLRCQHPANLHEVVRHIPNPKETCQGKMQVMHMSVCEWAVVQGLERIGQTSS